MANNILTTLKREHDALRELFEKINATTDRAEKGRQELLEQIEQLLIPHAKWEENTFYPAFAERADRDGLKTHAEALTEHSAVENSVLPAIHEADVTTPEFAGRVKVLSEFVSHHAREEENTLFRMARELFTAEELAEMDEQYAQWKESAAASAVMAQARAKTGVKAMAGKLMGH